ncbi:hypothetical protein HOLleu_05783 [Holothuria leucospilota]|uniref:NIDO domain-containing protein n=1 Tax=Holothuria leucospilota TaxID=206669 RepID=A0A9Q1CK19_HOLLE|nr:hypothetical protein HOLleu_05783 [Holothuria leucospilota]
MWSTTIIVACLSSYVASTPLMGHKENPENIIFFPGGEDAKLIELDRSIYNMREQNGGAVVNNNGYLSQDNLTTPKELRYLLYAYLSGVIDEDYVPPQIGVFKMSATTQRFTVLKTYFRELQDSSLEEAVRVLLRKGFDVSFDPDRILLGTWNQFCPRSVNGKVQSLVKTFECILAVNKNSSYAIFISDDTDPCLSTQSIPDEDNVPTEPKDLSSDLNSLDFMTSKGVMTPSSNETWNMTPEEDVSPLIYSDYEDNVPSNSSNPKQSHYESSQRPVSSQTQVSILETPLPWGGELLFPTKVRFLVPHSQS